MCHNLQRSFKVIGNGAIRYSIYDFLLVVRVYTEPASNAPAKCKPSEFRNAVSRYCALSVLTSSVT